MADHLPNINALTKCASMFAALIGEPEPNEEHVRQVVENITIGRGTLECVSSGVLTKDEAVLQLLAHYHSALFRCKTVDVDHNPWANTELLNLMKQGLLGQVLAATFG